MKKFIKRVVPLVLIVVMCVCMAAPAFADGQEPDTTINNAHEENSTIGVEIGSTMSASINLGPIQTLNGCIRSTSLPTSYWNLGNSSYSATLTQVGNGRLYTNYYFKPNSSGEIYTSFDVAAQGGTYFRVGIYDMSSGSIAYVDFYVTSLGYSDSVRFYNLDTSKNYAVYFQSLYAHPTVYVAGSATISR